MRLIRTLPALATTAALAFTVSACGDPEVPGSGSASGDGQGLSGEVAGAGASSQEAARQAWIAGFQGQNPDATVSYDPVGSGGGREQFVAGGTAFGGTDAALADERAARRAEALRGQGRTWSRSRRTSRRSRLSTTSTGVDGLQLSPETLAEIFNQQITNWNDPAIAKDNPDAQLPDQRITAVNRSDESGTTENFPTTWPPSPRASGTSRSTGTGR